MKNFVQAGEHLTLTVPGGGVVSGTPLLIGSLLVVPTVTVTADEVTADPTVQFVGLTVGVVSYTKPGSQAWAEGVKIYWNGSVFTTTSGGGTLVGVAAEAVGSGSGEVLGKVRLDGVAR